MRKVFLILLVLFSLLAIFLVVQLNKRTSEEESTGYQSIEVGRGKSPSIGQYVKLNLLVRNAAKDTLHFIEEFPYFLIIHEDELSSALCERSVGDSGVYMLKRSVLEDFYAFGKRINVPEDSVIYLYFRLMEVIPPNQLKVFQKEALFDRKIKQERVLDEYLQKMKGKVDTLEGEVYRIIERRNPEGIEIRKGSKVHLDHIGRFFSGYEFINTLERGISPFFYYGKEFELLEAVEVGLEGIKSGEKLKIILPSQNAFGEEGSVAGVVPPNTAIIYEIDIINVE